MTGDVHSCRLAGERWRDAPLPLHVDAFAKRLQGLGYARSTSQEKLRVVGIFGRWLQRRDLLVAEVDEQRIVEFLGRHARLGRGDATTLRDLLETLREDGVVCRPTPDVAKDVQRPTRPSPPPRAGFIRTPPWRTSSAHDGSSHATAALYSWGRRRRPRWPLALASRWSRRGGVRASRPITQPMSSRASPARRLHFTPFLVRAAVPAARTLRPASAAPGATASTAAIEEDGQSAPSSSLARST